MNTPPRFSDPLLQTLADACAGHPTAEKWVLLRSAAQGRTVGLRLAREGRAWLNLRFMTPALLARRLAAPELVRRGWTPLHRAAGPVLAGLLLHEKLGRREPYFRKLAGFAGLARVLWEALAALRTAGVRPGDLEESRFVSPEKGAELRAALERLERELAERKLADDAAMLEIAIDQPKGEGKHRLVLVDGAAPWSSLERRLIESIPGDRIVLPVARPEGLGVPKRLMGLLDRAAPACAKRSAAGRPREPAAPQSDAGRLRWLFSPGSSPPALADGTVSMFRAAGHDAEVQEVLRRILASGRPLDEFEIVCAAPDPYTGLIRDACLRAGIEPTLSEGIPATQTRPGRVLAAFCRWAEEGFAASALVRLLQSGDLRLEADLPFACERAAALLDAAAPPAGLRFYGPALESRALACEIRAAAARSEGDAEREALETAAAAQARLISAALGALLRLVPDPDSGGKDGRITPLDFFRGLALFLARHLSPASEDDRAHATQLLAALDGLGQVASQPAPLAVLARQVAELVHETRALRSGPRPGRIHVSSMDSAGWESRAQTFVVGLDQGAFPGSIRENPVLLDSERRRISPDLALSGDRASEALFLGGSRLASLGGKVTFSYASLDLRQERELYPASLLLQVHRLEHPERIDLAYGDLLRRIGPPVTRVPERPGEALDRTGWWLASLRTVPEGGSQAVLAAHPDLSRGERALQARNGDRFTAWDGHLPSAEGALDPRRNNRPVSPSALEQMGRCPFQFFLERALGLSRKPQPDLDPDRWLDPSERGRLLHAVYAGFFRSVRAAAIPPAQEAGRLLCAAALDLMAEIDRTRPAPGPFAKKQETGRILRDLEFFAERAVEEGRTPVGIEVPFGFSDRDSPEPLSSPEPVEVDLGVGCRFRIRGQIDRIDRLSGSRYEVIDYKTGRPWPFTKRLLSLAGGRQLQHALYAIAAEKLLRSSDPDAVVCGAKYLFATLDGRWSQVLRRRLSPEDLRRTLEPLLDQAAQGVFPQTEDEETCSYCELKAACGERPWKIGRRKRANETEPLLAPARLLAARMDEEAGVAAAAGKRSRGES